MTDANRPQISSIHHTAYRCRDAEQTRWFYQDVLGLELAAALAFDKQSGLDADRHYMHLFFDTGDGSFIAFFDDPDMAESGYFRKRDGFDVHIAFKTDSLENLDAFQKRIRAAGITCLGPLDHGFCKSVYVYDPNGIQVEVAANKPDYDEIMSHEGEHALQAIKDWTAETRGQKLELFGAEAVDKRGRNKGAEAATA